MAPVITQRRRRGAAPLLGNCAGDPGMNLVVGTILPVDAMRIPSPTARLRYLH